MLASVFAGSKLITVEAASSPYFTIEATITDDPYWGLYGGYHDIWDFIQIELAKINITLTIEKNTDPHVWWNKVWGDGWNHTGNTPTPGGWDLTLTERWMMPTGLIGLEPLVYSWLTPWPPPKGYNIFPWLDERADSLLWRGMHTLDAVTRKNYLWAWQEEFMHNPPMVNVYSPRLFEVTAPWVEGWDAVVRFRDVAHLAINETLFNEYAPEWRKTESNTLIYAVGEPVWSFSPLFIETKTEQWMCDLVYDTLYDLSIDPWPPTGQEPPPLDFFSKPALAAAPPILMEGPNGPNTRARVLLRGDIYWSDGIRFNATDVKFTFDLVLDPGTEAVAYSDLEPVVESVEIVNETCVDFILYESYADLTTLLSHDRGLAIIPWYILKDIPPELIRQHTSNFDWTHMLPGTGPFNITEYDIGDHITFEKNSDYFGYGLGWGPFNVSKIVLQWMPDAAVRLIALINHQTDFCEYAVSPVELFVELRENPEIRVWEYDDPSSNLLFFNLNNPYLSNRYVRQAIAHAIPYVYIIHGILPGWGIPTAYPGMTPITPLHYYTYGGTTVHLFNEDLAPIEYDITKAAAYMKMWAYAQPAYAPYGSGEVALGPVGDANFDGEVDFDDFFVYAKWRGSTAAQWTWDPGCDVDPDWDNSGGVSYPVDFDLWMNNYRNEYPFEGAR